MLVFKLYKGDCQDVLPSLKENSIDTVITDPPYGLGKEPDIAEVLTHWLAGDDYEHRGGGFMGKTWDSFVPGPAKWKEVYRVLKPGGMCLVFGGTRTYDLTTIALRMAGFKIRDAMMWLYGSGFAKSHDIGKGIDKRGGNSVGWFGPWLRQERKRRGISQRELAEMGGFYEKVNHGGAVTNWELGYNLPTVEQFNQICELLDLPFKRIEEAEREIIGEQTKARSENGKSALPTLGSNTIYETWPITAPATPAAKKWDGWGTSLKPAWEPVIIAMKPLSGNFAENALVHGVAGLWIDGGRIPANGEIITNHSRSAEAAISKGKFGDSKAQETHQTDGQKIGRWPTNVLFDEKAAQILEEQNEGKSRFFYCAKANRREASMGLPDSLVNNHPTVKPLDLCQYLARLTKTPTGGIVLDPFCGSGSIGVASILEGRNFIGIDIDEDPKVPALEIAEHRLKQAMEQRVNAIQTSL